MVSSFLLAVPIGVDIVMELVSSLIALVIAYYAAIGYKATLSRSLLHLNISFSLLGCGLLVDGLLTSLSIAILKSSQNEALMLFKSSIAILYVCEFIAFGLLLYSYLRMGLRGSLATFSLSSLALMRGYIPVLEALLVIMLLLIFIQAISNASSSKTKESMLVSMAFLSLCLSHIFFMLIRIWIFSYIIAHLLQLLGFVFLLAMLLIVRSKR